MSRSPVTLLVTGGSGFLGRGIVRLAMERGHNVRATYRRSHPEIPGVEWVQADLADSAPWRDAAERCDAVIHAAGLAHQFAARSEHQRDFDRANVDGTLHVVRGAVEAGASRVVIVSSVSVYGGSEPAGRDESGPIAPKEAYGRSKARGEMAAFGAAGEVSVVALRLVTLYGENDPGNVGRLMRTIDRGRFVQVGSGLNRKSLLYRDDAAAACLAALTIADGAPAYNVVGEVVTMSAIIEHLSRLLGRSPPRWFVPASPVQGAGRLVEGLLGDRLPRVARLRRTLDRWLADDVYDGTRFQTASVFEPQIDLEEGLRRQVAAYQRRKAE